VTVFTIDTDNNIAAHAKVPEAVEGLQQFTSAKELSKLTTKWPANRLVEIWNSFAGVAPFDDLKPSKKFPSRKAAITRIWEAIQRLAKTAAPAAAKADRKKGAKKKASNSARRGSAGKAEAEPKANKKAEVIELMKRPKGATAAEIIEITGWQKHTVRGFVSILGSKGGEKVESIKNAGGERSYRITK
jgi:hypothetical protein